MRRVQPLRDEPPFYLPANDWRFAALHVIIVRPSRESGSRAWPDIKTNQEEIDEAEPYEYFDRDG
jgi:hypothetical protein